MPNMMEKLYDVTAEALETVDKDSKEEKGAALKRWRWERERGRFC